jgi:hypothetical protein
VVLVTDYPVPWRRRPCQPARPEVAQNLSGVIDDSAPFEQTGKVIKASIEVRTGGPGQYVPLALLSADDCCDVAGSEHFICDVNSLGDPDRCGTAKGVKEDTNQVDSFFWREPKRHQPRRYSMPHVLWYGQSNLGQPDPFKALTTVNAHNLPEQPRPSAGVVPDGTVVFIEDERRLGRLSERHDQVVKPRCFV